MPERIRKLAATGRLGVIVVALVGLVLGALLVVGPYLDKQRDFPASTPQPYPLFDTALIKLAPGQQACLDNAVINPQSGQARIRVGTYGKPGQPLALTIVAPSDRQTISVPGTWKDNDLLQIPVRAPTRTVAATVCVRNAGRLGVALYSSDDRTHSDSQTRVNGKLVGPNFDLAFYERRPQTILDRATTIFRRASWFRPVANVWLLWALAVLFVFAVPLSLVWVMWRAVSDDEPAAGR